MDVSSLQFLGFALGAAVLYNLRSSVSWRQAILLLVNLAFLAAIFANWKNYLPLALFLALGYLGIRLMQKPRWRVLFVPLIVAFILIFMWLKRYTIMPGRLFLPYPYLTIGLSYIFFRVMHLIIDTRDEALPDSVGVIPYLTYTLNFTTLIAGPIQLYPDFAASQLAPVRPPLTLAQIGPALRRIAIGFFKLKVISLILPVVQSVGLRHLSVSQPLGSKLATGIMIAVTYTFYLYFNFSGYVDLMIGVAQFFRLPLPENFNRPFSATSFLEFWGRWHITLSHWLKTYVYTPLLKSLMDRFPSPRVEPFLGVFAYFVTFFLVGFWHGQTSEFLWFGVLQGAGVSLNKLYQIVLRNALGRSRYKALDSNPIYRAFSRGLTFTYFTFTLLWFWSNWSQLHQMRAALTVGEEILLWLTIWLGATAALALWEAVRARALAFEWNGEPALLASPVQAAWAVYLAGLTLMTMSTLNGPAATPVLYQIF